MSRFAGIDHIDARVRSLRAVEPFYDHFFPALGLARKRHAVVDADGEWSDASGSGAYNVAEYYEDAGAGRPARFVGIIEDPAMTPSRTRIAFALASAEELDEWFTRLHKMGAQLIEWSADRATYPAIFFEDPAGTKLELCARMPG